MSTVASMGTAVPPMRPGWNRHCCAAISAWSSRPSCSSRDLHARLAHRAVGHHDDLDFHGS
jgi:hypothetical protein